MVQRRKCDTKNNFLFVLIIRVVIAIVMLCKHYIRNKYRRVSVSTPGKALVAGGYAVLGEQERDHHDEMAR